MRHDRKLAFLHPWLTFLYWVAITVGVGFSLSGLLSNLPMLPSALQGRVAWAKDHSSEWTPVAILAAVLVDRIRKVVPQPWPPIPLLGVQMALVRLARTDRAVGPYDTVHRRCVPGTRRGEARGRRRGKHVAGECRHFSRESAGRVIRRRSASGRRRLR